MPKKKPVRKVLVANSLKNKIIPKTKKGEFSNVLLKRMEKIKNSNTENGFFKLWNNEIKLIQKREKEKPELKNNPGYDQWKLKITKLYIYCSNMKGFKDPTKSKPLK